jgi:hypothetical protein
MILRVIVGTAAALLMSVAFGESRAADQQDALLEQMTAFNKAGVAAYSEGELDKAKGQLLKAVALSKKDSSLLTHPLMARTYVHLGVLFVDGFEDRKAGVRYFSKALKIRPDITVTEALATKTVKSAFDEAGGHEAGASGEAVAQKEGSEDASENPAKEAKEKEEKAGRAADKQSAKATTAERKRAEADDTDSEGSSETQARAESKERTAKEKVLAREKAELAREKTEKEVLLSETKGILKQTQREKQEIEKQAQKQKQELEKEKQETEKRAQSDKSRLEKELAQVKESEAKERAAKEKLQTELQEKERQVAEVKTALQQLQKEKADKEKQLADTGGREKKEREAKEKLEKEKQALAELEKARKAREEGERLEREKLTAGPDMPSHFSDAVYCAMPDEAKAGTDLFVHCATQPNVKANVIAFYYRPSGGILYNAVTLEPAKKGWHATIIPADKVTGKVLQYYTEARDSNGALVAATGKAASPNILPLKSASGGTKSDITIRTNTTPAAATQGRRLKLAR